MKRYFTVEEAERLLPFFAGVMSRVIAWRKEIESIIGDVPVRSLGDLEEEDRMPVIELIRRVRREMGFVNDTGAMIKGLEQGLVDFWSIRDGEEVLLCWRLGEERIEWWHPPESGFGGRQRLVDRPVGSPPLPN